MLGFHRRTRSLIPVRDLARYDKVPMVDDEAELEVESADGDTDTKNGQWLGNRKRQMVLIYAIYLAESIIASGLEPQLRVLIDSNDSCENLSTSYLRSILECAYYFGGTTGILWGYLSDRAGRRCVTLTGLWGMVLCCLSMGFATDLVACTLTRFLSGVMGASVLVSTLAMIGDLSDSMTEKANYVAYLPLVSLCGSIGPVAQAMITGRVDLEGPLFARFPALSTQIACSGLLLLLAITATAMLKETLDLGPEQSRNLAEVDCEKVAFLSTDWNASSQSVATPFREPIAMSQFIQAPSFLVLLSSFSFLSLHSSMFDELLPHFGHNSAQQGGMGVPCTWLAWIVLGVRAFAGVVILRSLPQAMEKAGLLNLYRYTSLSFPSLYVATPILAMVAQYSVGLAPVIAAVCILLKHMLTSSSTVLVSVLILNTPPDAFSTGTVVGMMQVTSLFRALAVALGGATFYLSDETSMATTNCTLWISLALLGSGGAALAYFVKERPSVERDFPSEVLRWETCFDAIESDENPTGLM
ncbi:MFS general substrate transporter [Aaosphaeria arxii CBS 175.79]|uniref:MFS general substrate transporter n=1 Tax=Aaosphaeria arxii CBS 175.79 TaxID=1450172 RepID=A0A6A5XJH3_9PLEO|nr:MFS general substrate transporter [Aaosphaeria arxii CBS 175.79]KAF2013113.1 MFS general substrate transporter [Aaosphaeria arxii CBS 175.79]